MSGITECRSTNLTHCDIYVDHFQSLNRLSRFARLHEYYICKLTVSICISKTVPVVTDGDVALISQDGEAHLRSSVETLCNMFQLVDQLTDAEFQAMLPTVFSGVVQLMAHCRDRQLREALARWSYRVGLIFEFAASVDRLTPVSSY